MKRTFPLMIAAAALIVLGAARPAILKADTPSPGSSGAAVSGDDPPARVGRISYLQGGVTFTAEAGAAAQPAALNYPLTAGNGLETADGARAEVHVGSTALRLGPGATVTFEALDDQSIQVRLDRGRLGVGVRSLGPGQAVQVDLQTASISFGAPGSYRVDQQDAGPADLVTWTGDAVVTGGQASFHVTAGQGTSIPATGPDAALVASAPAPDDWDLWAASRDQREANVASARYVSREADGVEDLDDYGSWSIVVGLGPVWIPSGLPAGWAPYTAGHWAWIEPWGWTWVDDAPWGFAPFHYGRWVLRVGAWCWVPGPIVVRPVFAPALVHWNGGIPARDHPPDFHHVNWTPLRPGQVFHPPYPVSRPYFQSLNGAARFPAPRPGTVTFPPRPSRKPPSAYPQRQPGSVPGTNPLPGYVSPNPVRPFYAPRPPSNSPRPQVNSSRPPSSAPRPPGVTPRPPASAPRPPAYAPRPPASAPKPPGVVPRQPSPAPRPPASAPRPPAYVPRPPAPAASPPQFVPGGGRRPIQGGDPYIWDEYPKAR